MFRIGYPKTADADPKLLRDSHRTPCRDRSQVTLFEILDDPKSKGKTIHYLYNFAAGWEHVISCAGRADATAYFACVEGEGHGCAEDVPTAFPHLDIQGQWGWRKLLMAYEVDNPTQEQEEKRLWFETKAANKDPKGLKGENKRRWDKDRINAVLRELGHPVGAGAAPSSSKSLRSVLVVSLEKDSPFDGVYADALAKLRSKAIVNKVTHIVSAMKHLSMGGYAVVVVTDTGVMEKDLVAVKQKLVDFAKAGGTVIFGFFFARYAGRDLMAMFFEDKWDLKWKFEKGHDHETFTLNPRARANFLFSNRQDEGLLDEYSVEALLLSGAEPENLIYVANPQDPNFRSPAVFAKYGKGFLGWIGDVNTEVNTVTLLLTMCGIHVN